MAQAHPAPMPAESTLSAMKAKQDLLITLTPDAVVKNRTAIRKEEITREIIFEHNPERWVLLPIEFPSLWELYKKIETRMWTPGDFDFSSIPESLPACVRAALLDMSCAWAIMMGQPERVQTDSTSDVHAEDKENVSPSAASKSVAVPSHAGVVGEVTVVNKVVGEEGNPVSRRLSGEGSNAGAVIGSRWPDIIDVSCEFVEHVQSPEARAYLGFQTMFENFHREVVTEYIQLFSGAGSIPRGELATPEQRQVIEAALNQWKDRASLEEKLVWFRAHTTGFCDDRAIKILEGDRVRDSEVSPSVIDESNFAPMAEVLVALAVMKCIFFAGFALVPAIPGVEGDAIVDSSRQLWKDCLLHADFATHIYASLETKLDREVVRAMVTRAAEIEYNFVQEVFAKHFETAPLPQGEVGGFLAAICRRLFQALGYDDLKVLSTSQMPQGLTNRVGSQNIFLEAIQMEHPRLTRIVPIEKKAVAEAAEKEARGEHTTTAAGELDEDVISVESASKKRRHALQFEEDF